MKLTERQVVTKKVVQFYTQFSNFNKSIKFRDNGGRNFLNFIDKNQTPDSNSFKGKEKFPKRYLIWQAIDELGNVS